MEFNLDDAIGKGFSRLVAETDDFELREVIQELGWNECSGCFSGKARWLEIVDEDDFSPDERSALLSNRAVRSELDTNIGLSGWSPFFIFKDHNADPAERFILAYGEFGMQGGDYIYCQGRWATPKELMAELDGEDTLILWDWEFNPD